MTIPTCFSPTYSAITPTPSMTKLAMVANAAVQAGYAQLHDPGTVDPHLLRRLHDPRYVDAFLAGQEPLASTPGWDWTAAIRDGVLAINAGQLAAARLARAHGIAANIGNGFHHATWAEGADFCTFNGLALVALAHPEWRVFVLDCDEHCGNGTASFTPRLPNLFNYSICGTEWDYLSNERSRCHRLPPVTGEFESYREALREAFACALDWRPDLIIYQAGADPHQDDPLGSLHLTTQQLLERDRWVFRFARKAGIPLFFVLAGGYQKPIETKLVPLHLNTFKAACECDQ